MTPKELADWQECMGLSALAASRLLCVSYATYRDWLAGKSRNTGLPIKLPAMLGLACTALADGRPAWNHIPEGAKSW